MTAPTLEHYIEAEIVEAEACYALGDSEGAFRHLERAHVLAQQDTVLHTRIHWLMLMHGIRERDVKEIAGQVLRIGGAITKTPFGIYPKGNTGGANVNPIRPMPVEPDLAAILESASRR